MPTPEDVLFVTSTSFQLGSRQILSSKLDYASSLWIILPFTISVLQSPVNLGVLSTMVTALNSQARLVSGERVSMLANSLADHLTQKISTVTEKDRRTGFTYPIMDERVNGFIYQCMVHLNIFG